MTPVRGKRGKDPEPPAEERPRPSDMEKAGEVPRELLQAWVQFIRDDLSSAINGLNNRLNAIRLGARGIDPDNLKLDERTELERIETEVTLAAGITAGLLHRIDKMAPVGAPKLIKKFSLPPSKTAHVLIVEDDDSNRGVIARLFRRLGYLVTPARNGMEAWEALELAGADCIVCDIRMPGLGGQSLYQQVEEHLPQLLRRFVFVTGDYTNPQSRKFLDESGCPVIAKPYEVEDLLEAVAGVLSQPR